ncbi:MAG: aminoglycoside adenylyltransferase domain-containing protein [Chloroflexota bacterium]
MSNQISCPTPYTEVNAILNVLLPDVQEILGDQFVGLYLHGSLAYGDFDPQTSDIDFLVVTESNLAAEIFANLREMHAQLFNSGLAWSQKIEGAYTPKDILRRHDTTHSPLPWLGVDGHFALERLGSDWTIQRWILRERGVVVTGPPPKPMIDPVSAEDLRNAVHTNLCDWWTPPLPSSERFQNDDYQVYAILTMCRSLYVLESGRIASKPEAAKWAMGVLGYPWHELITLAATWRPGIKFDKLDEMMEFIFYTLNCYRKSAYSR